MLKTTNKKEIIWHRYDEIQNTCTVTAVLFV